MKIPERYPGSVGFLFFTIIRTIKNVASKGKKWRLMGIWAARWGGHRGML